MEKIWYPYLSNLEKKDSLFKVELPLFSSRENYFKRFFVCRQNHDNGFRTFGSFENYIKFWNYINSHEAHWHFFEIIVNKDAPLKPYFDIDIKKDEAPHDMDFEKILFKFISFLEQDMALNQDATFQGYTSSSEKKVSFHVICTNLYLENMEQVKDFCLKARTKFMEVEPIFAEFIDPLVYKSNQQLRMCYSGKFGTTRIKVPIDIVDGVTKIQKKKDFEVFENSLVSMIFNTEGKLRYLDEKKNVNENAQRVFSSLNYSLGKENVSYKYHDPKLEKEVSFFEKKIKMILKKLKKELDCEDEFPFDIKEVHISEIQESRDIKFLICFKRLMRSFCKMCDRVHEHENPFALFFKKEQKLFFYCRRNQEKKMRSSLPPASTVKKKKIQEEKIHDSYSMID